MIRKNSQAGFGIVGIVAIIVVLAIIGSLGWVAYKNLVKQPTAATRTTASQTTEQQKTPVAAAPNPYSGWKMATLKYEQIAYQYPANWTVTDKSISSPKGTGCVYPGIDDVILTSPTNDQVALMTGVECIGTSHAKTFDSMPVTSLGQKLYITLAAFADGSSDVPTNPTSVCLSPTADQTAYPAGLKSKNIFVNSGSDVPFNDFCYKPYAYYTNPNATAPKMSASEIEASSDFATAKLIFESMKYVTN